MVVLVVSALAACVNRLDFSSGSPTPTVTGTPTPLLSPTPLYGQGTDDLDLTSSFALNVCAPVNHAEGAQADVVGGAAPVSGQLVILIQVQDGSFASGTTGPIDPTSTRAGIWELARGQLVTNGSATLDFLAPLTHVYTTDGQSRAEICTMLEKRKLSLGGFTLFANPWGGAGGFVGVVVSDTLDLSGAIKADKDGFRGAPQLSLPNAQANTETSLDAAAGRAAHKGEGIDAGSLALYGAGNRMDAGGGGNASCSGGGGGGGGGRGGVGGDQSSTFSPDSATRGMGGLAMDAPEMRLLMGGGGGGGDYEHFQSSFGGSGGGIVLILARRIIHTAGTSLVSADGGGGLTIPTASVMTNPDGAGGGGGGGTILVVTEDDQDPALQISALGGNGGSVFQTNAVDIEAGPGGGGGGGRVLAIGLGGGHSISGGNPGAWLNNGTGDNGSFGADFGVVGIEPSGLTTAGLGAFSIP